MRFRSVADRSCKLLRSFLVVLSAIGAEPQALRFFGVLQIGQQPLIAEIEWLGILPIPVNDIVQTVNHFIFVDFNREFTPAVEAARSQIDRSHNRRKTVGQKHLGVQFEVFELVDLDSHIMPMSASRIPRTRSTPTAV